MPPSGSNKIATPIADNYEKQAAKIETAITEVQGKVESTINQTIKSQNELEEAIKPYTAQLVKIQPF